ncbi:MAG: hypothetical protein R2715_10275 [Ilumatobacteraceae bacterium]
MARLTELGGGDLVGRRVAVLGACYRGGVKDGVLRGVPVVQD